MKLLMIQICIGLINFKAMGDMALSKNAMLAPITVTATETISFYNKEKKKRKLSTEESKIFQFVQVANDIFKIDDFVVNGHYDQVGKEKALITTTIAKAIQNSLKQNINLDKPISNADLAKVIKFKDLFKKSLGSDSFTFAWLSYKKGNKALAKSILNRGFDRAYDEAMKMQHIGFSEDGNPIQDGKDFAAALTSLSTEAENKERDARIKKMQIHASNLPQIMT